MVEAQDPTFGSEPIENVDGLTEEEWRAVYGDEVPFPDPVEDEDE
jgi:hypothetical protein